MLGTTFLQIFLLVNVFIIGIIFATALRHAWAHFKTKPGKGNRPAVQPVRLPPEIREQMLIKAQADFKAVLDRAAVELENSLKSTSTDLSGQLEKIGKSVTDAELESYKTMLESLQKQAETIIVASQSEITNHQTDIKTKLNESASAEKQRIISQLDTKLGDAISSFLSETLQHNVDLGAQMPYMIASLEEHKSELIKGISDEE